MIHSLLTSLDPALLGSLLGTLLLVPFSYFTFDVRKNPKKYLEH